MSEIKPNPQGRQDELPAIAAAAPATTSDGKSPGARLREAREALGMSIADAAQAIRLSQRQITQLEEGAWDQLPGETFVRGFLRNYARLLKLDPEPLLATVHNPEPQAIELPESSKEELPVEGSSGGQMVPILAGAGLLLIAAVLVYLFWPQTSPRAPVFGKPAASVAPSVATGAPGNAPGDAAGAQMPPSAASSEAAAPAVAAPSAAPTASEPAPVPASTATASTPAAPAKAPTVEAQRPTATPASAAAEPRAAKVEASGSAVETPTPRPFVAVDGPQRALRISVRELSWVEVRDAGGNTLIAYNFEAGTVRNVRGVAPLEIIVGNAAGVDVTVDGEPIDVAARARSNVAKLTVE